MYKKKDLQESFRIGYVFKRR